MHKNRVSLLYQHNRFIKLYNTQFKLDRFQSPFKKYKMGKSTDILNRVNKFSNPFNQLKKFKKDMNSDYQDIIEEHIIVPGKNTEINSTFDETSRLKSSTECAVHVDKPNNIDLLSEDCHMILPFNNTASINNPDNSWLFDGSVGIVLSIHVICNNGALIDGSKEAIQYLYNKRIPFLIMANDSMGEDHQTRLLSSLLEIPIYSEQIIMPYSPMKLLAKHYANDNVLIGGPPTCTGIMKSYGFNKAISIKNWKERYPELIPFRKQTLSGKSPNTPCDKPILGQNSISPYPCISAIFMCAVSHDAFNDIQVILDLLQSNQGVISPDILDNRNIYNRAQSIPLYMASDELFYPGPTAPRLGGGAFREMLCTVYSCATGTLPHIIQYGKPRSISYKYAERQMEDITKRYFGWKNAPNHIIMIGDNIETDIVGANALGKPWISCHITGLQTKINTNSPYFIGTLKPHHRNNTYYDPEYVWIQSNMDKLVVPHYVCYNLNQLIRELSQFPKDFILLNTKNSYLDGKPHIDMEDIYNFSFF